MNTSCGSGQCSCGGASTPQSASAPDSFPRIVPDTPADTAAHDQAVARVNGIALHPPGQRPDDDTLRQRAHFELLRQAAAALGLAGAEHVTGDDGIPHEAASQAVEALLEQALQVPQPDDEAGRRLHAAHARRYTTGEQVLARHILLAVTPGVNVVALRQRAEQLLVELRSHAGQADDAASGEFARQARQWSNCPSSEHGGELGWLTRDDCAPEFAREVFASAEVGVLPRLIHSRHGLHVVQVLRRRPGQAQPYESVREAVRQSLRQLSWATALRQYLGVLAGQARIEAVDLDSADTPLTQ